MIWLTFWIKVHDSSFQDVLSVNKASIFLFALCKFSSLFPFQKSVSCRSRFVRSVSFYSLGQPLGDGPSFKKRWRRGTYLLLS